MDKTSYLLQKEIEADHLITESFIRKYSEEFVKQYRLGGYYRGIDFDKVSFLEEYGLLGAYNPSDKKIYLDDDKIISSIIETSYLKDKDAFSKEDMKFIYAVYLLYVTHELSHVRQSKIVRKFMPDYEASILKDNFKVHDNYYSFYLGHSSEFISEHNANVFSSLEIANLIDDANLFEDEIIRRKVIALITRLIIKNYSSSKGKIINCPAQNFYSYFKEKDKFYDLDKYMPLDNYLRLKTGMPIDISLYKKLLKISNEEATSSNVKKLIIKSSKSD